MDKFDHKAMQEGYDEDMNPIYLEESDYDRADNYRRGIPSNKVNDPTWAQGLPKRDD